MLSTNLVTEIGENHYLVIAALLFTMGMAGVLLRRNMIVMMMSIELMLNSVNLTFITFSKFTENYNGHIMAFFVMTVAAAEAAVGLALAVAIFKKFREVNIRFFEHLKG